MMLTVFALAAGLVVAVDRHCQVKRAALYRRHMALIYGSWEAFMVTRGILIA